MHQGRLCSINVPWCKIFDHFVRRFWFSFFTSMTASCVRVSYKLLSYCSHFRRRTCRSNQGSWPPIKKFRGKHIVLPSPIFFYFFTLYMRKITRNLLQISNNLLSMWGTRSPHGRATFLKVRYKTMLQTKRTKKFWLCTPTCDILGYNCRKWGQQNLFGAKRQLPRTPSWQRACQIGHSS